MRDRSDNPRVLFITPEVTYLPAGMGSKAEFMYAKAGGLADVSAALIDALYRQGADVHVALPDYRTLFNHLPAPALGRKQRRANCTFPQERIHLARDSSFFYLKRVYTGNTSENLKLSMAFQREVINHIVPIVEPDLIHCNDWTTGLIPAMARQQGIPCLFTIHNIHSVKASLAEIEDRGIDAASFWQNLFYEFFPSNYENTRASIPVDFLLSGIFGAHFINTVSPNFLFEIVEGRHDWVGEALQRELTHKLNAGCAVGILNAPDPSFNPAVDDALVGKYGPISHFFGKKANKAFLQKSLGLLPDARAPLFFWPSRLDPVQKGCHLLDGIIQQVIDKYRNQRLQIVFVADGVYQSRLKEIVRRHAISERVAVRPFNERLARLAYGAADFVLVPSSFEPCGLPQMIGAIYGALPVVHNTGGLHDTVKPLNLEQNTGNGFLFDIFDPTGLAWAVDQAMGFYMRPNVAKEKQVRRIMRECARCFSYQNTARDYIALYEKMLQRPLIGSNASKTHRFKPQREKTRAVIRKLHDGVSHRGGSPRLTARRKRIRMQTL